MKLKLNLIVCLAILAGAAASCSESSTSGDATGSSGELSPFDKDVSLAPVGDTGNRTTTGDVTVHNSSPDVNLGSDAYDPWGVPKTPDEGRFGWPCTENSECDSGFCVESPTGKVCADVCLENCPPAWVCSEVSVTGADTIYICKPKYLHLCDPCVEHLDCSEGAAILAKCLSYGDSGRFCAADCSADNACPNDYTCENFPDGSGGTDSLCVPLSGECACSPLAAELNLSTVCAVTTEDGNSCEGSRICTPDGLTPCDAEAPTPDICDGIDSDCDGVVDDDADLSPCEIKNDFGTCPGTVECNDGVSSCVGKEAIPEICDGLDNDCNGVADDGLCEDGDPCTLDICQTDDTCENPTDNSLLCDDGDTCTEVDKCEDGVCVGYQPVICDDKNPCTDDFCDPVAGCLTTFNNEVTCEDGSQCTENDFCENGVCKPGPTIVCDDDNPCTSDACVPASGCVAQAANQGVACNAEAQTQCQLAACQAGVCVPYTVDGVGCNTANGDCPLGICNGGQCKIISNQSCQYDAGVCESDVPGICTPQGSCLPTVEAGCVCSSPCPNGICVCCKVFGLPLSICIN